MAINLRVDEKCRKSLMKYFRDNEKLYGEVSVHIAIAISDFLLEYEAKEPCNYPHCRIVSDRIMKFLKFGKKL